MAKYYVDYDGSITTDKKKKKKNNYYVDESGTVTLETASDDDIAPVKKTSGSSSGSEKNKDVAKKPTWVDKGAFEDGVDGVGDFFGSLGKTVVGTLHDVNENLTTAVVDATENLIDTTAYGVGAIGGLFNKGFKEDVGDFIAKEILKPTETGEAIATYANPIGWANLLVNDGKTEENSVLGDKADGLVQSGAHLAGSYALQAVGVPAWLTMGVNAFGGEIESAFQNDATYEEAGISGAISAVAEIVFEKMSSGIKFKGGTLDDGLQKWLTTNIKNKVGRTVAKYTSGMLGEGLEEVATELTSSIGKKLTYMDDKEFNEIMSSEDALDAFIGGALISGIAGGGQMINAKKKGVDYTSGLTDSEEKVVMKVYEDTIAEKEKGGSKLSTSEKNKIYDSIVEQMSHGQLDIDTIESTLGGDAYKAYQDTVASEEALKTELNELRQMEYGKMNDIQRERLAELKAMNLEDTTKREGLRKQLNDTVFPLIDNSRLAESYNEIARRNEAFTADLSQYKGKQKESVDRAIKSGVLNNTYRSHELVNILSKIEADKGIVFDYTNNEKLKESGFAVEGKTVNGFVKDGGVTLNVQSSKAWQSTVGHEITHVLEGTEAYGELRQALFAYAESKGELASRKATLTELYKNIDADIDSELTADLVGEYLFTDKAFVDHLTGNRTLFQKIYDEIKYLCKVATGKELTEIEKVKREFDRAWKGFSTEVINKELNEGSDVVRYSLAGWDADGIEIYETSQETKKLSNKEKNKRIIDLMQNEFKGRTAKFTTDSQTYYAHLDKIGLQKGLYGDKKSSNAGRRAKANIGADGNYIELVENATFDHTAAEQGKTTDSHKKVTDWDYFVKEIASDGVYYDVLVNVRKTGDGEYVYDVNLWENKNKKDAVPLVAKTVQERQALKSEETTPDVSVAHIPQNVNDEFSEISAEANGIFEKKPTDKPDIRYSISKETDADYMSAVERGDTETAQKMVDEAARRSGYSIRAYHGTNAEFFAFDKGRVGKGNDQYGAGFYFASDKSASEHYGGRVIDAALKMENPFVIASTNLLDSEITFTDEQAYEIVKRHPMIYDPEESPLGDYYDSYWEDGVEEWMIEDLAMQYTELGFLDSDLFRHYPNELHEAVRDVSGRDGIVVNLRNGEKFYIAWFDNQMKTVDPITYDDNGNVIPLSERFNTESKDIRYSISNEGEEYAPTGKFSTPLNKLALEQDTAPVTDTNVGSNDVAEDIAPVTAEEANAIRDEKAKPDKAAEGEPKTRKQLHSNIVNDIKATFSSSGYDFDDVLSKAKDLSTFSTVDNTPQRVMEKALGYKEGQILSDMTVNKVAQNETEGIKWLNSFTDRKSGLLAQLSKQYNIKPGSKQSAAAQMYAEGFYVNDNNDIIEYGDAELARDFPDVRVQNNIKGLANDPRIRQVYDETLTAINESRTRNAYPEIQRLDNYFLHFRAMEDTFSRLGLPFNPNDIRAKDLPTDLNGVTADLKPGQPYFASANHRMGKRTSFDLLGGLEKYLTSAKNQIYHIDDIQTLRALRNYIADNYGQAHGLESIDMLSEEEAQEKIEQVYGSHLSTFAKFLNEEANVLAGKTALIDRGLEGIIGRRGMTFLDTVNRQVGSNMVGFNISSSLTNFLPVAQTFAKTNKYDFVKAFAQTASNKLGSIVGKGDSFAENSPVVIRRKGADRFYRTPFQKVGDAGYVLMSAVDDISTELIARTKFNELTRKGMSEQQAHFETDKWVSRLMGDRSLGQQPQMYNSKTLGVLTKFQLEVRNQLDSQFYDTIQEAKVSNEDIENGLARNAKIAAKVTSTFVQLAVVQHLFGKAFESVAGYNPAFDIISVIATALGLDDDEDSEDTVLDNVEQGFLELLEDLPYTSTFTGGRIPISSALPIKEVIKGEDSYGNEKSRLETLAETAPYYILPGGYGQIKKTAQGLNMFSDEHPVSGSYTDSGNLRFPIEDTPLNRVQAGVFGQYASENAREYFDNEYAPLKEKQIQEYIDVDMPIKDYWEYREGLKDQKKLEEKFDYVAGLDLPVEKKNILINNIVDRKEKVDLEGYEDFADYEEFDFAIKHPEKWDFLQANNISYDEYNASEESREAYTWASKDPEGYALSKVVADDVVTYKQYTKDLNDIKADKDATGKSISGSRKAKVLNYINNMPADYYTKIILFKTEYPSDDTYNGEIIEYINGRSDISYDEKLAIYTELGFRVANGYVYWD